MLTAIANVLSPYEIDAVRDALQDATWHDGSTSARGNARAVKNNQQGDSDDPSIRGVIEMVRERLVSHPVFAAAVRPDRFARLLVSRYEAGMSYGRHVDAPYIGGIRTDVSFTVFLTDPADYEGGALLIDGEEPARLPPGSCLAYPSDRLHEVEPVTRGTRLAVVGWTRSRIKNHSDRALVFEMDAAIADLKEASLPRATRDRLANLRNNLVRRFGD